MTKEENMEHILDDIIFDNNPVVVGVSSGPDSMCLLNLLEQKTNKLVVCHINHNVRKESTTEEEYLKDYCQKHNLIFESMKITEYKETNFENEARKKRYNFYEEILSKYHSTKLFLAHHGDDQIETILMKIVRGSNLEGYAGIKEISKVKNYQIIRPLLKVTKEDIINYNKSHNITYFIDSSNTNTDYTRNRYRQKILPLLKEEADMIEADVIMRYIRIFSDLSGQLKYAPQKRVLIEIALIKLCRPSMETTPDALTDRVAQLEKKVEEGVTVVAAAPDSVSAGGRQPAAPKKIKEPVQMPKAIPDDIRQVVKSWSSIVRELPGVTATYLRGAHLSLGGENKLMLVFDDDLAYTYVSEERRRTEITERISNRIGKEIEVVMQSNDSGRPFEENYIDLEQIVHMDIEVEDE